MLQMKLFQSKTFLPMPYEEAMAPRLRQGQEKLQKGSGAGGEFTGWVDLPRSYVREELAAKGRTQTYVPAVLTAKNADRLKHETAFHNPKNLHPNQLMNDILERYFKWLDEARA